MWLSVSCWTNRNDVQRVEDIDSALLLFNDNMVLAYENEFRVWNEVLFTVRSSNDSRSNSAKGLTDKVSIHL